MPETFSSPPSYYQSPGSDNPLSSSYPASSPSSFSSPQMSSRFNQPLIQSPTLSTGFSSNPESFYSTSTQFNPLSSPSFVPDFYRTSPRMEPSYDLQFQHVTSPPTVRPRAVSQPLPSTGTDFEREDFESTEEYESLVRSVAELTSEKTTK